jgi:CDP-glucose 4,6-dehydratase
MVNETWFVTGGAGFVGRNLILDILKNRPEVRVISLERDVSLGIDHPQLLCIKGDVLDFELLRRIIADYEITRVFHLAAQSIVRTCAADPVTSYKVTVLGTVNLLEAIRVVATSGQIKSILVSTSDKAYGHSPPPYNESTPLNPLYTYESTKACQDIVSQNYAHNYKLPVKIVRCSNIYGPNDTNLSRIIPGSILRVLREESPVLYRGVADYVREFVYVQDAIDAFYLVSQSGNAGEAYCIGGTGEIKIGQVMDLIIKLCGSNLTTQTLEKSPMFLEIERQWIDSTKLRALGWAPKFTLEQGLKETINFYKAGGKNV